MNKMINIIKIVEHKDGSATLHFEYDATVLHPILKRVYNIKRITKKTVRRFINDGITYAIKRDYNKYITKGKKK